MALEVSRNSPGSKGNFGEVFSHVYILSHVQTMLESMVYSSLHLNRRA